MTTDILVNITPRETRAAVVENGVLAEIYLERANRRGLTSNIYKGRASRVLPGMQAAFIEVGLDRTAFLHASDFAVAAEGDAPPQPRAEDIRALIREGDELLVQVVKDPLGTKGARLTTFVTLPSRYVVYMPRGHGIGVSARIEDEAERLRLRRIVEEALGEDTAGGYIVRTVAEGASEEALRADMTFLAKLWRVIAERGFSAPAGTLVHEDLPLSLRLLRDLLGQNVARVLVDSPPVHAAMLEFAEAFLPELKDRISLYQSARPIFDLHGVDEEIERALDRKVPLKSGGHLVIDQTEAMTTIDVNTGAYVGHRNLEDTIFRTNLEAAVTIARQLRLRNLGGIIIIDFIDMQDEEHRRAVMLALQEALATDRSQTHITTISPLGLVEMTRKRTRDSIEHLLCGVCPQCNGRGYVRTAETVCHEVFRELVRQSRLFQSQELLVLAHQDVVDRLLEEEAPVLAELEQQLKRPIRLQAEPLYGVDQYDVVLA